MTFPTSNCSIRATSTQVQMTPVLSTCCVRNFISALTISTSLCCGRSTHFSISLAFCWTTTLKTTGRLSNLPTSTAKCTLRLILRTACCTAVPTSQSLIWFHRSERSSRDSRRTCSIGRKKVSLGWAPLSSTASQAANLPSWKDLTNPSKKN